MSVMDRPRILVRTAPQPPELLAAAGVIAVKEGTELVASVRGLAWLLSLSLVLSGFGLLLVGSAELSLLDNAQVVYDMAGIVAGLGALLAVTVGADAVAGERERGTLVTLLLAPIPRAAIALGKLGGQAVAWACALALALPYLWAVGSTGQNLSSAIVALALFGTPVVLGFGFLALGLGARLASARATLLLTLTLLMLSASPVVLGPSLRLSAVGQAFDWVNPFSALLNALDAIIIDSQPIGSEAARFGVVVAWLLLTLGLAVTGLRRPAFGGGGR